MNPDDDWRAEAACHNDADRAIFDTTYDLKNATDDRKTAVALAKAVCQRCPVRAECRAEADKFYAGRPAPERFGVWGGHDFGDHHAQQLAGHAAAVATITKRPQDRRPTPPDEARDHMEALYALGWKHRDIALAAHVRYQTVTAIRRNGSGEVFRSTVDAILAIPLVPYSPAAVASIVTAPDAVDEVAVRRAADMLHQGLPERVPEGNGAVNTAGWWARWVIDSDRTGWRDLNRSEKAECGRILAGRGWTPWMLARAARCNWRDARHYMGAAA